MRSDRPHALTFTSMKGDRQARKPTLINSVESEESAGVTQFFALGLVDIFVASLLWLNMKFKMGRRSYSGRVVLSLSTRLVATRWLINYIYANLVHAKLRRSWPNTINSTMRPAIYEVDVRQLVLSCGSSHLPILRSELVGGTCKL